MGSLNLLFPFVAEGSGRKWRPWVAALVRYLTSRLFPSRRSCFSSPLLPNLQQHFSSQIRFHVKVGQRLAITLFASRFLSSYSQSVKKTIDRMLTYPVWRAFLSSASPLSWRLDSCSMISFLSDIFLFFTLSLLYMSLICCFSS